MPGRHDADAQGAKVIEERQDGLTRHREAITGTGAMELTCHLG